MTQQLSRGSQSTTLLGAGLVAIVAAASVGCSSGSWRPRVGHGASSVATATATATAAGPAPTLPTPTPLPPLKVARTLTVSASASFLRYALGSVWAVTGPGAVLRLTTAGKQIGEPVRQHALDVKFDQGHMYVLFDNGVQEVDADTGRVVVNRAVGGAISFDVLDGVAYVATNGENSTVEAVDMATGHTRTRVMPVQMSDAEHADSIAVTATGTVWAIVGQTLVRMSTASLGIEARYPLTFPGTTLRVTGAGVFVATQHSGGGVARLAPGATSLRPCWSSGDALQLAEQGSHLWASAAAGLTELDQRTCAVLGQAPGPDEGGTGVVVLPGQVWCSYPDLNQIQAVATQ